MSFIQENLAIVHKLNLFMLNQKVDINWVDRKPQQELSVSGAERENVNVGQDAVSGILAQEVGKLVSMIMVLMCVVMEERRLILVQMIILARSFQEETQGHLLNYCRDLAIICQWFRYEIHQR